MSTDPRWRGLAALASVAAVAAAAVALTWQFTAPRIAENERLHEQRTLVEVLPGVDFDNLLLDARVELDAAELLGEPGTSAWLARRDRDTVALVLRVSAPDGYNGRIRLLLGLSADGEVLGVRTVSHRETPGLGDAIEHERSDWIHQFDGRSLRDPAAGGWAVNRDGGQFDAISGATVTARAVVRAIRNALLYFDANREELLRAEPAPDSD